MKKFQLFLLLMASALLLNAGVIEKTWYFNNHEIKQLGEYQLIQLEGSMITGITGEPALPYVAVKLLLPPGEVATSIEFIGENNLQLPGYFHLYPQQSSRPLSDPGKKEFIPDTFRFGEFDVNSKTYKLSKKGITIDLSERELKLIRLFHAHSGEVLSRDNILNAVWGIDYLGTTRTLDQHIAQLRKKIEIDPSDPSFITTIHGVGYRYEA